MIVRHSSSAWPLFRGRRAIVRRWGGGNPLAQIGTLNEKPLHAALKEWIGKPNDRFEVSVDGFVIDIVRGDRLFEIQTRNFASLKGKLHRLAAGHRVRLIYPIAQEKWIVKLPEDGGGEDRQRRRKSPKRGRIDHVFGELVSFPKLLANPNFELMVLLIQEEEVRRHDNARGWRRRGWITHERRLLDVVDQRLFRTPEDMAAFLPPDLPEPFTTSDLSKAIGQPQRLAQKMAYCLREMGMIHQVGRRSCAILCERGTGAETSLSA